MCNNHNKGGNCAPCTGCGACKSKKVKKSLKIDLGEGLSAGKTEDDFDEHQLSVGMGVESEHTDDPRVARKIAMDHLTEDPEYYKKLAKIEDTEKSLNFSVSKNRPVVRRLKFQDIPVAIEVDKGQTLDWYDPFEKRSGKTLMHYPYGFIPRTEGEDGDAIDVFVGPDDTSDKVYVVQQVKGGRSNFKKFDEDKVMLGFGSEREAKAAYLMHYDSPKYLGNITETNIETFRRMWMKKSLMPLQQPIQPQAIVNPMNPMGFIVDPLDVDTFEGVKSILSRYGSIKDPELMTLAERVWGTGYNYNNKPSTLARQELLGFLLDQRDLLGIAPESLEESETPVLQQPANTSLGLLQSSIPSAFSATENNDRSMQAN